MSTGTLGLGGLIGTLGSHDVSFVSREKPSLGGNDHPGGDEESREVALATLTHSSWSPTHPEREPDWRKLEKFVITHQSAVLVNRIPVENNVSSLHHSFKGGVAKAHSPLEDLR